MTQQQPSVLVIDDESGILDTVRILLKKEGYEVSVAQGGKAGLEAIRSVSPDIVVTDVRMPQVTGLDAVGHVDHVDPVVHGPDHGVADGHELVGVTEVAQETDRPRQFSTQGKRKDSQSLSRSLRFMFDRSSPAPQLIFSPPTLSIASISSSPDPASKRSRPLSPNR